MAKEHTVNLSCSFCGKSQREVRKLIAGPRVFICDACIGLCNQILGDELSRDATSSVVPESARGLMAGLIAQQALVCAFLAEIEQKAGEAIPAAVRKPLLDLLAASRALEAEAQSWACPEPFDGPSATVPGWLRPCLERLGGTVDALRALRPALEGLVPGIRLKVIDEAVGRINEVSGLLATVATYEVTGES